MVSSIHNATTNAPPTTQTKYVDKVGEQLKAMVEKLRNLGGVDEDNWADPYAFKNMKEALKFTMSMNERLVSQL